MSILIRGMEMPTSCAECLLADCSKSPCYKVGGVVDWERRPDWCPLIEIPPHGRLIDADVLTKMCREMQSIDWNKKAFPYSWEHAYEEFENDIDEAPTIIEAEEGNTWI